MGNTPPRAAPGTDDHIRCQNPYLPRRRRLNRPTDQPLFRSLPTYYVRYMEYPFSSNGSNTCVPQCQVKIDTHYPASSGLDYASLGDAM